MDNRVFGYHLVPELIFVITSLFTAVMLPICLYAVFPFMNKLEHCKCLLDKMSVGFLLAVLSFAIATSLEGHIEVFEDFLIKFKNQNIQMKKIKNNTNCYWKENSSAALSFDQCRFATSDRILLKLIIWRGRLHLENFGGWPWCITIVLTVNCRSE